MTDCYVTPTKLRALFEEHGVLEQLESGELVEEEVRWVEVDYPHFPAGTQSRKSRYVAHGTNEQIALVHYYATREGQLVTIPDPKWLRVGGKTYKYRLPEPEEDEA